MAQEIRNTLLQFLYDHPRWSRALLYVSFVILALALIMSFSYYIFLDGRDDLRQVAYLQNNRFIVSLPKYINHTNSTTYPISISQSATSSQARTRTQMTITSVTGLLITEMPTSTVTFEPEKYQSFTLSVQHDLIAPGVFYDVGSISLHFEPSISTNPDVIIFTKETYIWSLIRKLFVIQSFTSGVVILVTGLLSLTIADVEQTAKRRNEEIKLEKERREANEEQVSLLLESIIQGDGAKFQDIQAHVDVALLDSETQEQIKSFSDEDFIKHFKMSKTSDKWQLAHLRFILNKAQEIKKVSEFEDIKSLSDQIEDQSVREQFLKSFFNLILKRRSPPSISIIRAEKGGGFQPTAAYAEYDNPSFYYVREDIDDDIDMVVEDCLKAIGIATITGPTGSGKTAYLRYRQASFDKGVACRMSMSHTAISLEQLTLKVSYEFTCQMFNLLCKHVYVWLWFEEHDQTILAWFFAMYLVRNRDYLDSPVRRLETTVKSTIGNTLDYETDQLACKSLVRAIQKASATVDSLEQAGPASQSLSRYGLLDLSTVLHNLKRDQPYEVLILLDDVPSHADLLSAQKMLDCSLVQPPQIIAAYSSDTSNASNKHSDVTLRWEDQQLRRLIEYRQERVVKEGHEQPETLIADTVLVHLINEIIVPRDIWPWWAALTYAREQRGESATDFLEEDWNLVAPPMQHARKQRRLRELKGPNWTMDDWTEALNTIKHSSGVIRPR